MYAQQPLLLGNGEFRQGREIVVLKKVEKRHTVVWCLDGMQFIDPGRGRSGLRRLTPLLPVVSDLPQPAASVIGEARLGLRDRHAGEQVRRHQGDECALPCGPRACGPQGQAADGADDGELAVGRKTARMNGTHVWFVYCHTLTVNSGCSLAPISWMRSSTLRPCDALSNDHWTARR